MRKQTIATIVVAALLGVTMFVIRHIQRLDNGIKIKQIELRDNSVQLQLLDDKYKKLNEDLNKTGSDKAKIEEQLKQLQKDKDSLQAQLQAKVDAKQRDIAANVAKALVTTQKASASGCNTGNMYKDYIYMHESGCNPSSMNSIGCRGIGQACPGSKLPCGADFACQDAYFSNYAIQRYGSWEAAYNFWVANHWW